MNDKTYFKDLIMADDGYYVYWPTGNGYIPAYLLHEIADTLDAMNAEWHAKIMADAKIQPTSNPC